LNLFVLITDLAEHALDLLEGVAGDHLLNSLAKLSRLVFILSVPLFTHRAEFILQGCSTFPRDLDVLSKLSHLEIVLVVVMHLSQGLLAVHLVLSCLGLYF